MLLTEGLVHDMDKSFLISVEESDKRFVYRDFSHCLSLLKMFSHLIQLGIYYRIK
jgi:hypothetical protein